MSLLETIHARFLPSDHEAVHNMIGDMEGMASMFGTHVGVIAYALTEVGQERLNSVSTKSEVAMLVAKEIIEEEDLGLVEEALKLADADHDEPPKADFKLFTQLHEVVMGLSA